MNIIPFSYYKKKSKTLEGKTINKLIIKWIEKIISICMTNYWFTCKKGLCWYDHLFVIVFFSWGTNSNHTGPWLVDYLAVKAMEVFRRRPDWTALSDFDQNSTTLSYCRLNFAIWNNNKTWVESVHLEMTLEFESYKILAPSPSK